MHIMYDLSQLAHSFLYRSTGPKRKLVFEPLTRVHDIIYYVMTEFSCLFFVVYTNVVTIEVATTIFPDRLSSLGKCSIAALCLLLLHVHMHCG